MTIRIGLQLNLGPNAPIDRVSRVLTDLSTVSQFGGQLQAQYDHDQALRTILANTRRWILPDDYNDDAFALWDLRFGYDLRGDGPRRPRLLGAGLESAVNRYLRNNESVNESITTVERLDYRNPIEIILEAGIITYAVLIQIRDWNERRRLNRLAVDDYESAVTTRIAVREHLVDGLNSGGYKLTEQQITDLLTPDVATAFANLGNAVPKINQLGEGQTEFPS